MLCADHVSRLGIFFNVSFPTAVKMLQSLRYQNCLAKKRDFSFFSLLNCLNILFRSAPFFISFCGESKRVICLYCKS